RPSVRDATIVPLDLEDLFLVYYRSDLSPRHDTAAPEGAVTDGAAPPRGPGVPGRDRGPSIPRERPASLSRALVLKPFRDARVLIASALVVVVLFEVLFVLAMKNLAPDLIALLGRFGFVQRLLRALIGLDLSAGASPTTLVVLGLLHPFLSAVSWGT